MDSLCAIYLLGELKVQQGDRCINRFRTQKAGALLAYLAYNLQRPHSREVLIGMLWPDHSPAQGRNCLNIELTSLRHQLEPPGIEPGSILQSDRYKVQLNPSLVATDVGMLEQHLDAATRTTNQAGCIRELSCAVDVYRDRLLPGFYEAWICAEQPVLEGRVCAALDRLCTLLAQTGDFDRALFYARMALRLDPLSEAPRRQLNDLLLARDRAAATRLPEHGRWPAQALPAVAEATVPTNQTVTLTLLLADPAPSGPPDGSELPHVAPLLPDDAVLRAEAHRRQGRLLLITEQAALAAFSCTGDALAYALALQEHCGIGANGGESGQALPVRGRIVLHTVEVAPETRLDPHHLVAVLERIDCAVAPDHIICTETTAALLKHHLPPGKRLVALRDYSITDTQESGSYFGLTASRPAVPAARTSSAPIPGYLTRFIGRESELADLEALLADRGSRLLTLIGLGGVGKTRIACELISRRHSHIPGDIRYIPLAKLAANSSLLVALAEALQLPAQVQVSVRDQLTAALGGRPTLLVLDGFEQVGTHGALELTRLLEKLPALRCLLTSRVSPGIPGEIVRVISPLPVPDTTADPVLALQSDSVRLFVECAQRVRQDFQVTTKNAIAVTQLCERLEGIPLAIELAAARAGVLCPAQILRQLSHRLDFLVSSRRDAADRHCALRVTLDWSFDLLPHPVRQTLTRLSVFHGGATLDAIEAVCALPDRVEHLEILRTNSLLTIHEHDGEMRCRLLGLVREYAAERLGAAESDLLRARHAEWMLQLAQQAAPHLRGPQALAWLERLDFERDNLRAALDTLRDHGRVTEALQLGVALWRYWHIRGLVREGREQLSQALAMRAESAPAADRAAALHACGHLAWQEGDYAPAVKLLEHSLVLYQELGDTRNIALALNSLGPVAWHQGDYALAILRYQEGLRLCSAERDVHGIANATGNLGLVAFHQGRYPEAESYLQESLRLLRALEDQRGIAEILNFLGLVRWHQGENDAAAGLLEESLQLRMALGDRRSIAYSLDNLAHVTRDRQDLPASRNLFERSLQIRQDLGDRRGISYALYGLGLLHLDESASNGNNVAEALRLLERSLDLQRTLGDRWGMAQTLEGLAVAEASHSRDQRAARLLGAASTLRATIGAPLSPHRTTAYERQTVALRKKLGAETFTRAWESGKNMLIELVTGR